MLLVRFLISCLIPDKPDWVATEMAKVEFARREAANRVSSTTSTSPSATTSTEATIFSTNVNSSSGLISDSALTSQLNGTPIDYGNAVDR